MKIRHSIALLCLLPALVPAPVPAQQTTRTYVESPVARQRRLPFSAGVLVGNTLYIAGTTGVGPDTHGPVSPAQEARLVMDHVRQVVERAGLRMDDIVSLQVFCTDLANYGAFNGVYRSYFHKHYPARSFVGVSNLLFGARYEVMGIAVRP